MDLNSKPLKAMVYIVGDTHTRDWNRKIPKNIKGLSKSSSYLRPPPPHKEAFDGETAVETATIHNSLNPHVT